MEKQRALLGFFAGATLFMAFGYLYPPRLASKVQNQPIVVSAEDQKPTEAEISFKVLDEGINAPGSKNRKNYALYSQSDLKDFWKIAHGDDGKKEPSVDFKNNYVIVAFAGSKPTGGYKVEVIHVQDLGSARNVSVRISGPGDGCTPKSTSSAPYQFIQVPFGNESTLSHNDVEQKIDCK